MRLISGHVKNRCLKDVTNWGGGIAYAFAQVSKRVKRCEMNPKSLLYPHRGKYRIEIEASIRIVYVH